MSHSLLAYSQSGLKFCLARELHRNTRFSVTNLDNFNPPSDEDAHYVDTLTKL